MEVDFTQLQEEARRLRLQTMEMLKEAGSGHPGGSLSEVELLTVLYSCFMKIDPDMPLWPERDRFVLSKGHANPPLYALLANKGFFPQETLMTLRKTHSILQGHPDMHKTPGVDYSTGSLGQGLSAAVGMALAAKHLHKSYRVYVLTGDGELQEGMVWEAFMAAAHYCLDNLTILIDYNKLQIDGPVAEVMSLGDLEAKLCAFGLKVIRINGHDLSAIYDALSQSVKDQPLCILADTIKGRGVSFMENNLAFHGALPQGEKMTQALQELGGVFT